MIIDTHSGPVTIYTLAEAAELLGILPDSVARYCRMHGIGRKLGGKQVVLTEEDMERLRNRRKPGRPGKPRGRGRTKP